MLAFVNRKGHFRVAVNLTMKARLSDDDDDDDDDESLYFKTMSIKAT